MRRHLWILVALFALGLWLWAQPRMPAPDAPASAPAAIFAPDAKGPAAPEPPHYPAFLPIEAHAVLDRIAHGGPFDYRQDGGVFQNRERQLPPQPRGYYREYTVETPDSSDRGARRIITGGEPPHEYWYTDDHYRSFRRFEVSP
ncbi:guanyl-specific ribonuclease [Lysobacter terrae]